MNNLYPNILIVAFLYNATLIIYDININLIMSLEMFTTHELEEGLFVSSCNKNEQLRFQAWFRCKNFGYFTKPVKNITNGIFICHR